MPAGITVKIDSYLPDRLYLTGTIYYSGNQSSFIQTNVKAALYEYMKKFSTKEYGGRVTENGIIDAIQSVQGVKDIRLTEIAGRFHSSGFSSRNSFYNLPLGINELYHETYSGYIIEEDEPGQSFLDKLYFVPIENL